MNGERQRLRVLYVSDLGYEAKGRRYCDEDIYLSGELSAEFDVAICPPLAAEHLMDAFDVVVVRNSGPVLHYLAAYDAFREAARTRGVPVFTDLTGRADQMGEAVPPRSVPSRIPGHPHDRRRCGHRATPGHCGLHRETEAGRGLDRAESGGP
ncbi:hypothetical protein JG550_001196 [Curtobacterium flaccumfaciens pv. flaccumfaciens]|uniref:hypothetical protein n=1 Tax=Curtobacterium flaccumfaciens TaxID=2035 RepID=UPI001AD954E9|nr:hypothetical protein [Curtobacterium flaccumfaciens]MBO9047053.1 hypothetical protein [Curtobacterium flaccumfaciens pv. flaccumfaciens]QTR91895.1 hypothetical protein JG550_001196 [Curtobacterium flaccumfaciens pv. flaccumfaciens]QVG67199.1 hypothetical protein JG551_001184 [Curtobacterium flaccumfaciens pv. flaccumfaciens]